MLLHREVESFGDGAPVSFFHPASRPGRIVWFVKILEELLGEGEVKAPCYRGSL